MQGDESLKIKLSKVYVLYKYLCVNKYVRINRGLRKIFQWAALENKNVLNTHKIRFEK